MKTLAISYNAVRRMLRERSNIFFVFIFPMLLIVVIGVQFGGGFTPRLAVVDESGGEAAATLVAAIDSTQGIEVREMGEAAMVSAVERGTVDGGVVIPADFEDVVEGTPVTVEYLASTASSEISTQLEATVGAVVREAAVVPTAADAVAETSDVGYADARVAAMGVRTRVGDVTVAVETSGEALFPEGLGQFDVGAPQQLLLFTFLTSLAGSAALIQSRRWGVITRMLSTPTSTGTILFGEASGRFAVALVQGAFILLGSLLLFSVNWGDPVGATAVLLAFSAVGAGAGMLLGSTLDNDQQAGGLGVMLGLGFAAIGGCMVPIEVFPETMQRIAHITPHAWGLDAYSELIRHDGTVADILPELGVLAAMAVFVLAIATWALRRKLTA